MEKPINIQLLCNKTPAHSCGYLPGQQAVIRFMHIDNIDSEEHFTQLNAEGYRRSGAYIYQPSCPACDACLPLRVPSKEFIPNKSQRRCWKKNSDLTVCPKPATFTHERYSLYEQYIHSRHTNGDMFPPSEQQFNDFLCEGTNWAAFYEFRCPENKLVAAIVADKLTDGLAALYTFYSPKLFKRGLGTYSILWLINLAQQSQLPYVYLGYWIKTCDKMSYKCRFQPYELLRQGKWTIPSCS